MSSRRRILLVEPDLERSATVVGWLRQAGHDVVRVGDFGAAKSELDEHPPDLLITELKLGAFNGLHLAIRARMSGTGTRTIVLGEPDAVLQAEAQREGTKYVPHPLDQRAVMAAVEQSLGDYRPSRRSPRKRVPRAEALVGDVPVSLLDISYEGLRLEVPAEERSRLAAQFTVRVPTFHVACPVRCVWVTSASRPGVVWCGAVLDTPDLAATLAWRELVDEMPGWTLIQN
jgi:DNA-binding response OmpR family regulator